MSQLHRSLLANIMAAIDPVIETTLTVVNPLAGAGSRVLLGELEAMENAPDAPASPHDAPVAVAGTTINSPLPAPVAPPAAQVVAPPVAPPAPAPLELAPGHQLTAKDVIAALMQTLQGLQSQL